MIRKSIDKVNQLPDRLPGPAGAAGDEVFERIHALMHRFRSEQHRAVRGGAQDVTHMESKVLGFFARNPGATQSALAAHSGRDKGQLARLIAGLKERGLLSALADEADRRNMRLQLTADGRAVQRALQRKGRYVSERALSGLTEGERAQLVVLLDKVRANLDNAA
jgi:DNA-binding MarR family transcriptional regulator